VFMEAQTDRTFESGGRGDVEWAPLAEMTLSMRRSRRRGENPKKILQLRGTLRSSIKSTVRKKRSAMAMVLFSRVPYAGIHQDGGTVTTPAQTIRPRKRRRADQKGARTPIKKRALRFEIGGKVIFVKSVNMPEVTRTVPQRQFMFFTTEDVDKATDLLIDHAVEIANESVKKSKGKK